MTITMFAPFMSEEAIDNATNALRSRWIGEGDAVRQFEEALCEKFGFRHALLLNNGTAGLRLALAVAGVGPGDEVITTPMTCTATNTSILEQYATPVFADIQWETGNLDPSDIEHRITPRTKAIICVHWGGYPCDLDEIHTVAKRHNLPVIEDAAHALGARYHGRNVGAVSEYTMFSFQAIKHLTTVDGGLLVLQDGAQYQEAKERRWFGIDRDQRTPSMEWPGYSYWPQRYAGYKYQPTNVQAAIGLGNLEYFDEMLERRERLARLYQEQLANVAGVTLFQYKGDRRCAWWLFTVHVESRWALYEMLRRNGVETSVCHIRNDLHPVFGARRTDLPNLDRHQDTYLCLPLHQGLMDGDVERAVGLIREFYGA
jgi:perosamine synthetase